MFRNRIAEISRFMILLFNLTCYLKINRVNYACLLSLYNKHKSILRVFVFQLKMYEKRSYST